MPPTVSAGTTNALRAVGLAHKLSHTPAATLAAFRRRFADHARTTQKDEKASSRKDSDSESEAQADPANRAGLHLSASCGPDDCQRKPTIAESDAQLMERWRERQGSLANAELEDGQVASGYRRNVKANIFRYI